MCHVSGGCLVVAGCARVTRDVGYAPKTVEQQVGAVLRRLGGKLGQFHAGGASLVQVCLRRGDIAGLVGTALESASPAMSQRRKAGVIDSGRKGVFIISPVVLGAVIKGHGA